jgi:acetyl-CoA carboxylase carboxyltransferase component
VSTLLPLDDMGTSLQLHQFEADREIEEAVKKMGHLNVTGIGLISARTLLVCTT